MKPAGKQATHCGLSLSAAAAHWAAGAGLIKLTVFKTVVEENKYDVRVDETTNWFLLIKKNLFSLKCWPVVDISMWVSSSLDDEICSISWSGDDASSVGINLGKNKKIINAKIFSGINDNSRYT